jgi:hypothetical protein
MKRIEIQETKTQWIIQEYEGNQRQKITFFDKDQHHSYFGGDQVLDYILNELDFVDSN